MVFWDSFLEEHDKKEVSESKKIKSTKINAKKDISKPSFHED